jgi:hypothetical protein
MLEGELNGKVAMAAPENGTGPVETAKDEARRTDFAAE